MRRAQRLFVDREFRRAVLALRRRRQQFQHYVGETAVFFPDQPVQAFAASLDSVLDEEEISAGKT